MTGANASQQHLSPQLALSSEPALCSVTVHAFLHLHCFVDVLLLASLLLQAAAELDVVGKAVVGCLAQLAVAAGSDALWKTLNHQVRGACSALCFMGCCGLTMECDATHGECITQCRFSD